MGRDVSINLKAFFSESIWNVGCFCKNIWEGIQHPFSEKGLMQNKEVKGDTVNKKYVMEKVRVFCHDYSGRIEMTFHEEYCRLLIRNLDDIAVLQYIISKYVL